MDKSELRRIILEILREEAGGCRSSGWTCRPVRCTEADRLDTGDPTHRVYTHDLFSLEESPRLGCGLMEMERTAFPWTLRYDEIDYIISGRLTIRGERQGNLRRARRGAVDPQGHVHRIFSRGKDPIPLRDLPCRLAKSGVAKKSKKYERYPCNFLCTALQWNYNQRLVAVRKCFAHGLQLSLGLCRVYQIRKSLMHFFLYRVSIPKEELRCNYCTTAG